MKISVFVLTILVACTARAQQPVLLISLDGLRPDFINKADERGLKIPFLRQLLKEGAHAEGVRGVLPTSTYPSHTTIMTGVWPEKHGIISNHPFDPQDKNPELWFWFSEDIKVPTLWDAAAGAGMPVASISWPVSIGSKSIKFNIGEYNQTHTDFDLKMLKSLSGNLIDELSEKAGPYLMDISKPTVRDASRTKFVIEMLRQKHPKFMTVHFAATDHLEHTNGPFNDTVYAAVEEIDKMLAAIHAAAIAEDPKFVMCIVSDHGFSAIKRALRLDAAFVKADLIKLKDTGRTINEAGVTRWTAMPWPNGGSAAIVMKNPDDAEARAKVKKFLDELAADPNNGIAEILDKPAIAKLGGTSSVEFWVCMKSGFMISGSLDGPIVADTGSIGTHGFSPTEPDMLSTFMIAGAGIRKDVNVGEIDMRSIAPTIAKVMGVGFPGADLPALDIFNH